MNPNPLPRPLPAAALALPLAGRNLAPGDLAEQLGREPTLLVFLRHLGCLFCRETVAELRRVAAVRADMPAVLLVHQGGPDEGEAYFARHWPAARAIADPDLALYAAFDIHQSSPGDLLQPGLWACALRATVKGHRQGGPQGDVKRMPGLFLIQGDRILWEHLYRHAGDSPDFDRLPDLARALAGAVT